MALPGGLTRASHSGKIDVYYPAGRSRGRSRSVGIVVASPVFRTEAGIGPCSSEKRLRKAYPRAQKVSLGRRQAYRVGPRLWFEIVSGRVAVAALGSRAIALEAVGTAACGGGRDILLPPGKGTVWNGVYLPAPAGVVSREQVLDYEGRIGKKIASEILYIGWYQGVWDHAVRPHLAVWDPLGITAQISWMPSATGGGDPVAAILSGSQDAIIDEFAREARRYRKPFFLRLAHEMNGDWMDYGSKAGRNPADFISAWRYVWKRFRAAGATNAVWIWSPNWNSSPPEPWNDLSAYYPGDAFVDWVGVDFYGLMWEDAPVATQLDSVYSRFSRKPVMVAETAAADCSHYFAGVTHTKDQWIYSLFAELAVRPAVRAFYWFNIDKEADWRVDSCPNPAALDAFRQGVADSRFLSRVGR